MKEEQYQVVCDNPVWLGHETYLKPTKREALIGQTGESEVAPSATNNQPTELTRPTQEYSRFKTSFWPIFPHATQLFVGWDRYCIPGRKQETYHKKPIPIPTKFSIFADILFEGGGRGRVGELQ